MERPSPSLLQTLPGSWYVRISDDETKQDVQSQRDMIARWLQRHELSIPHHFRFEDAEGYTPRHRPDDRPAFQRLMAAVRSTQVRWIVIDHQYRFGGSDPWHYAAMIHELRKHRCQLWTVDDELLTADDALAFFQGGLKANASKEEQHSKARHVIRGKRTKALAGEYHGGYVPYELDVICFDRATNIEQWRVQVEGHYKRLKIWADGRTERFDGKGNFPAREANQFFRLGWSVDQKRVEVVQTVFGMFAKQAISAYGISNHLNRCRVKPNYREEYWLGSHIYSMLRNTAYIGRPASNKFGQGEFLEDDGEQVRPVICTKGRRERPKTAWWIPDHEVYPPLVAKEVWDKVQAKLDAHVPQRRAPKTADLWLAGFVRCARCGKRMRGQKRPNYYQFSCPTGEQDKSNKFGCLRNAINQQIIERIVIDYLNEIGEAVNVLRQVQVTGETLLLDSLKDHLGQYLYDNLDISLRMAKFVHEFAGEKVFRQLRERFPTSDFVPQEDFGKLIHAAMQDCSDLGIAIAPELAPFRLSVVYDLLFEHNETILKARFEDFDEQRKRAAHELVRLPDDVSKRTLKEYQKRLLDIEQDLGKTENMLDHLTSRGDDNEQQTKELLSAIANAKAAIREDEGLRGRTEALGQVIDQINVWFEPTGKKYPTTVPVWCEIVPKFGSKRVYRFDGEDDGPPDGPKGTENALV
ncbi:MAG TPA: recombinase family protein [Pirellulales bacterium]|jgi:DNA invertase Pin-like site-specific DNA recombinase|nr:recombinase family protein [Pirellulales bacterium]